MPSTVCFTGHRAKFLCGWSHKPYEDFVRELTDYLDTLYQAGCTRFISGGAQGFDQLAFWAVNNLKHRRPDIENILYLPLPDMQLKWAPTGCFSQTEFELMLKKADKVRYISQKTSGQSAVAALFARNRAMVNDSDLTVALYEDYTSWDTAKGGTADHIRYAVKQNKPVVIITYDLAGGKLNITGTDRI